MNNSNQKKNSLLFNLITLLTFGLAFFLIIFLKQGKGKKVVREQKEETPQKSRVQNSIQITQQPKPKPSEPKNEKKLKNLNQRQATILEKIEEKGRMSPSEIYELVPNVSTRTVRRDMDKLVQTGFVTQKGTTKSTQYIFKG